MPNPNSSAGADDTVLNQNTDQGEASGAQTPDANARPAGSSDAGGEEGANSPELDLEAVVRKAAQEAGAGAEDSPTDGKGNEGDKPADDGKAADAKPVEKTDEEKAAEQEAADAKLPFHKHPRWQEMKAERDALRGERDSVKAQLSEVSGKAEQFDVIGSFMHDNQLTAAEVQKGFEIMALMKHDPAAALEKLAPHIDVLSLASGRKLPADLQSKVDSGEVTAEIAQETARARMEARAAQQRAERSEQTVQQDRVVAATTAMRTAVEGWEADVKARDPDYPRMQSFIVDRTRVLMTQRPPRTPDEAKALAQQAYDDVKAQMRKALPKREATTVVKSDNSSTRATPAPSTLEDVVRGALR
jgi:hypothetical protein